MGLCSEFGPLLHDFLHKAQGIAIDAESQAARRGAIRKHVPQVPVAFRAQNFNPRHAVALIGAKPDILPSHRKQKRRPARAAVELIIAPKERQVTARAVILALKVIIFQNPAEGGVSAMRAQDLVLIGLQALAPFRVGQNQLIVAFRARFFGFQGVPGQSFLLAVAGRRVAAVHGQRRGERRDPRDGDCSDGVHLLCLYGDWEFGVLAKNKGKPPSWRAFDTSTIRYAAICRSTSPDPPDP